MSRIPRSVLLCVVASLAALAPSCATTGAEGQGDLNLPTVGVGPFRKLAVDEVPGIAPFVVDDRTAFYREPSVIAGAGDSVILYAVGKQNGADVIIRTRADDGRSFFGTNGDSGKTPPAVLEGDVAWEGGAVSGPFAIRINDEVLLYYAAAGGIGLARSTDGLVFRKQAGPILARDPASLWETTPLRAPTVIVLPDARLRMFYESGSYIFEAESTDGIHFQRVDPDPSTPRIEPVLSPASPAAPGSLLPNERGPFDTGRVGDPCASVRMTPAGRLQIRVLYTGAELGGATAIGFAARYGDSGFLTRQPAPVYSVGQKEAAPALLDVTGGSYLYVQQDRRIDASLTYSAIAAAFAPGAVHLPMPAAFPDTP